MENFERNQISPILIVEDSAPDYESVVRAFKKLDVRNPLYRCESGDSALDFLFRRNHYGDARQAPRPGIILLDLNLPGMDGWDVLKEIKISPDLKSIPVVVLTTSSADEDVIKCYQYGAHGYITKPNSWEMFLRAMESFKTHWLETVSLPSCLF